MAKPVSRRSMLKAFGTLGVTAAVYSLSGGRGAEAVEPQLAPHTAAVVPPSTRLAEQYTLLF